MVALGLFRLAALAGMVALLCKCGVSANAVATQTYLVPVFLQVSDERSKKKRRKIKRHRKSKDNDDSVKTVKHEESIKEHVLDKHAEGADKPAEKQEEPAKEEEKPVDAASHAVESKPEEKADVAKENEQKQKEENVEHKEENAGENATKPEDTTAHDSHDEARVKLESAEAREEEQKDEEKNHEEHMAEAEKPEKEEKTAPSDENQENDHGNDKKEGEDASDQKEVVAVSLLEEDSKEELETKKDQEKSSETQSASTEKKDAATNTVTKNEAESHNEENMKETHTKEQESTDDNSPVEKHDNLERDQEEGKNNIKVENADEKQPEPKEETKAESQENENKEEPKDEKDSEIENGNKNAQHVDKATQTEATEAKQEAPANKAEEAETEANKAQGQENEPEPKDHGETEIKEHQPATTEGAAEHPQNGMTHQNPPKQHDDDSTQTQSHGSADSPQTTVQKKVFEIRDMDRTCSIDCAESCMDSLGESTQCISLSGGAPSFAPFEDYANLNCPVSYKPCVMPYVVDAQSFNLVATTPTVHHPATLELKGSGFNGCVSVLLANFNGTCEKSHMEENLETTRHLLDPSYKLESTRTTITLSNFMVQTPGKYKLCLYQQYAPQVEQNIVVRALMKILEAIRLREPLKKIRTVYSMEAATIVVE